MVDTQQEIKKKSNTSMKRPNIQIAKRKGPDKFFSDLYGFQNSLLLGLTADISDPVEREIEKRALAASHKYSLPAIIRKIVKHSIDSGLTPETIFDINQK